EPASATRRTPEVFPYAHTHAALSFTAGSAHRRLTECRRAADPTPVELDGPPSWTDVRRAFACPVTSGVIDAESLREGPLPDLANRSAGADRNSPYASELRDVCAAASP